MSVSKENKKTGMSIETFEIWAGSFSVCGKTLELEIIISNAEIIPPILVMIARYEGKTGYYNFQYGQNFHWEFAAHGKLGIGSGVLISLTDWRYLPNPGAELKITGYDALSLCSPIVERIDI